MPRDLHKVKVAGLPPPGKGKQPTDRLYRHQTLQGKASIPDLRVRLRRGRDHVRERGEQAHEQRAVTLRDDLREHRGDEVPEGEQEPAGAGPRRVGQRPPACRRAPQQQLQRRDLATVVSLQL